MATSTLTFDQALEPLKASSMVEVRCNCSLLALLAWNKKLVGPVRGTHRKHSLSFRITLTAARCPLGAGPLLVHGFMLPICRSEACTLFPTQSDPAYLSSHALMTAHSAAATFHAAGGQGSMMLCS